jgi:hypothetical protein
MMAGLDNVTQTETTEESTVTPQVTPSAAPKGSKYALPTVKGTVGLDSSILQQMQNIIAEKEAKRNSFGEGLRDVMAFDVGYRGDLSKGLRERAAEKEQGSADIFNMKSQIAQYKAAQENQKAFEARRNKELGLGGGDTTGAPAAPGAQPAGGGIPPEIRNALMNARTEEEYKKIYNEYAKEQAKIKTQYEYNPALDQIVQFPVNGQLEDMTLRQAKKLAENNPVLKARLEAAYPTPKTAAPAAATVNAPVATTAPAATTTPVAPPAAPVTAPAATTTPVAPPAATTTPVAPPAAPVTAPAAAPKPGVGGGSSTAIKANIEMQKDIETARAKERVGSEEERLTAMLKQGKDAIERADTASRINAIAEADPDMYGVLAKPGVTSAIGTLLKEGIKVGTHGQIALPSVEDMARRVGPNATPEKLSRVREMDGYLRKVELDFSSAFKGQGAVSDNERKIVQAIAGSTSDPADLLRKKAAWLANSAQKDKDMKTAWENFTAQYGENVPYSRFERSPAAKQITAAYEDKLRKQFETEIKSYGNRPLVSAAEYDKGVVGTGKTKVFVPSESQKATFEKYKKKN